MMRVNPTPRQAELLGFIRRSIGVDGSGPSLQEMADHLGLRSKSGAHRMLDALEARGLIQRLPNRARAIAVVDMVTLSPAMTKRVRSLAQDSRITPERLIERALDGMTGARL